MRVRAFHKEVDRVRPLADGFVRNFSCFVFFCYVYYLLFVAVFLWKCGVGLQGCVWQAGASLHRASGTERLTSHHPCLAAHEMRMPRRGPF